MRKTKKLLKAAGLVLLLAVAFTSVIACGGKQNDPAPPYDYTKPEVKPDTDADATIDGKFDDNIYTGNRWLTIDKNVDGDTGRVRMTATFGEKGLYFAYDVDDSVSVKNSAMLDSDMNSCIEMYLTVNADKIETVFQYKIDLMPTGDYTVKKCTSWVSGDTWSDYAVKDYRPTLAATTKNGNVNDSTCNGYTLEFFVPYGYLMLDGAPQSVSVNPVLISTYGNEATSGVNRCQIAMYDQLAYNYVDAAMHYRFDVNGLVGYDYTVSANGGAVVETNGKDSIIDNRAAKFEVKADAGKRVKSLTVNGEDKLGAIAAENGKAILDLTGIKENAAIVAEFESIPAETATVGGTLKNTTAYENGDLAVRLFDGTNLYNAEYDAATGAFSATVPQGENYKFVVVRTSDNLTVKEEKISLLGDITDRELSTVANVELVGADGVAMNAPDLSDGLIYASGRNLGENFTLEYFMGLTDHLFPDASENATSETHYAVLRAILYNGSEQVFYTGLEMRGKDDLAMWGDKPSVGISFGGNHAKYSGVIDYARANNGITFVIDRQGSLVTAYAKTSDDCLVKLFEGEVNGDVTGVSLYVSRAPRAGLTRAELVTEDNLGVIKNVSAVINPDRKAERAGDIFISDAAKLGLNGVKMTFTNKEDPSVVYSGTVTNGRLAAANVKSGTYSVKAELIPGTTTTGADFTVKDGAFICYEAYDLFRMGGKIRSSVGASFGENNSFSMPAGVSNYGTGVKIDPITGNAFVGTKIKFTKDEMVAMLGSATDSGLGIAMFTSAEDTYTGIQFHAYQGSLRLRTMQQWSAFVTLGNVADGKFTVTTTDEGWKAVANAIVGDGIYLVQQKGADNKLTYYFYNATKDTLLKKYETGWAYSNSDTICGIGTYRWNDGFAYTVADFRVATTLSAVLGDKNITPQIDGANGSVTFDKSTYKIGDTVTITLKPNAGYDVLESLIVNGVEHASEVSAGEYSFTLYDARVEVEVTFGDRLDATITVTDAAKLGLNGVKFTLTNKADESIVYEVTADNGSIVINDAKLGTYSVKAVLIPGTTTTGADITINVGNVTYDPSGLFRTSGAAAGKFKNGTVSFGENNSISMPSGVSNGSMGINIDPITGNVFVGTKIKFTNADVAAMLNSGSDSGLGIAMFTSDGDTYTGIQFHANKGSFNLRTMQNWGSFVTLGSLNDGNFVVTTTDEGWKAVVNAITGDGVYLVQQKAADNKLTYYFYNATKDTLLKKYETGWAYSNSDTVCGIGTYRWNNAFAYTVSDFRVATSLGATIGHEGNVTITKSETNGTVTLDKENYKIGDTATITLTAATDYPILSSLKINGIECASGVTETDGVKTYSFVVYDVENTIEVTFTDKLNATVTITDAAKLGLNGVKFTLTNKADESIVYEATAANGALAIANAKLGTYSVKAVLIPGTTTTDADITINAASLTYDPSGLFHAKSAAATKIKQCTAVSLGENNVISVPSNGPSNALRINIDPIAGNVFVGTKIKFTNDEMVAMINSGGTGESGPGIAMFTSNEDTYTGLQFHVSKGVFRLRTMQSWALVAELGNVTDGEYTVTTTDEGWKAVANALVGDGIYLVQQKDAENKLTYYFYSVDKTTLLKKYETGWAYSNSGTIYGVGPYRWNKAFAYTVSDFCVATTLEGVGVTAE